jgi:hypothetical protein
VLGVQPYTDLLGMGDLRIQTPPGIICRNCDTFWRDLDAFQRGDPEPALEVAPPAEPQPPGAISASALEHERPAQRRPYRPRRPSREAPEPPEPEAVDRGPDQE